MADASHGVGRLVFAWGVGFGRGAGVGWAERYGQAAREAGWHKGSVYCGTIGDGRERRVTDIFPTTIPSILLFFFVVHPTCVVCSLWRYGMEPLEGMSTRATGVNGH